MRIFEVPGNFVRLKKTLYFFMMVLLMILWTKNGEEVSTETNFTGQSNYKLLMRKVMVGSHALGI